MNRKMTQASFLAELKKVEGDDISKDIILPKFGEEDYSNDCQIVEGEGEYADYIPSGPTSLAIHASRKRIKAARGPWACGKSMCCAKDIFSQACQIHPNKEGVRQARVLVARNTVQQLRDSTMKTFSQCIPATITGVWKISINNFYCEFEFEDEHGETTTVKMEVLFRSFPIKGNILDDLKGFEPNIVWINEASTVHFELITQAYARMGRYPPDIPAKYKQERMIMDTNSFAVTHPLYKMLYDKDHRKQIKQMYGKDFEDLIDVFDYPPALFEDGRPNPDAENLQNLGEDHYITKAMMNPPDWVAVNLMNKFGDVMDGKPCYSSYVPRIHVTNDIVIDPSFKTWIGADGGKDACCVVFQEPNPGQVNIIDEFYKPGKHGQIQILDEMYDYLAQRYPPREFNWVEGAVDPGELATERRDNIKLIEWWWQKHKETGVGYVVAARGTKGNNPAIRIETVNTYLSRNTHGRPSVLLKKDKTNWLQTAMTNYVYKETKDGYLTNEVVKNDSSHIAEAFAYGFFASSSTVRSVIKKEEHLYNNKMKAGTVVKYGNTGGFLKLRKNNIPFRSI